MRRAFFLRVTKSWFTTCPLSRISHPLSGFSLVHSKAMVADQEDQRLVLRHRRNEHRSTTSMAGKCIYCILLLVHPCCQFVGAWESRPTYALFARVSKRHFSSQPPVKTSNRMSTKLEQDTDLISQIRSVYGSSETDGILKLAKTIRMNDYSPQQLVQSSIEAANGNKGMAAGILNAWIGACFQLEDDSGAQFALDLLQAYDDASDENQIFPDVVTLSLAYTIACVQDEYRQVEESILERAMKMAKKQGGSKRRKELAAARRRGPPVSCKDVEPKLQDLCGVDLKVLQESDDFVVISKPSGMVCFHKNKTTAGKARRRKTKGNNNKVVDVSLVDALLDCNVPLSTLNPEGRGLVHRIDRGTSGCIVLAKTDDAHAKLVTQFFLRRAKKCYTAIVSSEQPIEPSEGEINMPVHGRPAKSLYTILETYENGNNTKLQIETLTGRKHQVRVHCAEGLQSPILLDPIYATAEEDGANDGRFLLHASSLSIPEFDIDVEAPIPQWWDEALSKTSTKE